jgi:hypothetical protein
LKLFTEIVTTRTAHSIKATLRLFRATGNSAPSRFGSVTLTQSLRFDDAITTGKSAKSTFLFQTVLVVIIVMARRHICMATCRTFHGWRLENAISYASRCIVLYRFFPRQKLRVVGFLSIAGAVGAIRNLRTPGW